MIIKSSLSRAIKGIMQVIPAQIFDQAHLKSTEGLALALASSEDGAVMELQWCNKAFTRISGYEFDEIKGRRGTILIGRDMDQGSHLHIIEKLMGWQDFSVNVLNNRKNGDLYWQRMTWAHLTDPATGDHWWLCSIIELEDQAEGFAASKRLESGSSKRISETRAYERVEHLEKENSRLHELAKAVAKDANEDALTRLSNRRHFEVEMKTWIADLRSQGKEFAVLYIDLDHFKLINDTLGHDAGDRLLVAVADLLREETESTDLVARLGGDEFIILKPLGNSALNISNLADQIVQKIKAPTILDGISTNCSASVGVAIASATMDDPEQVVADADAALYHAKSQGRARWSFFTERMHAESTATKRLASDLLTACERREFIAFFQPLIDASTGEIASAEMLVRWRHPEKGLLAPDAFLDTAAKMGIIKRIDEIVFDRLREALAAFDAAGVKLPRVAVNVSTSRLADPRFIHDIKSSGVDPKRLTVEILESVYLERMGDTVQWAIDELDEMGVTIAIDDFGTGHASVQGLLRVKPAILKIDRQFIQPIVDEETSRALVLSIIGIGKSLGISIVAEGVETEEHARFVTEMGCDFLQGFHFGEPMADTDLLAKLVENKGRFWSPVPPKEEARAAPSNGKVVHDETDRPN